jgi:hypothetical protein
MDRDNSAVSAQSALTKSMMLFTYVAAKSIFAADDKKWDG